MNKKELITPILVIALTIAFAIACLIVYLSKGRSQKWLARKMKIGGLILTLSVASCNGSVEHTCYEVAAVNHIWLYNMGANGVEINLDSSTIIGGEISGVQDSVYSYRILDKNQNIIKKAILKPDSGTFDMYNESFKIELDKTLKKGEYTINFYNNYITEQDSSQIIKQLTINIKNE